MSTPIWQFAPQKVTAAELDLLMFAANDDNFSVSDYDHPRSRRTAGQLARKGLVTLSAGRAAGWEPDMWQAILTVNGWNAMWRANDNRHIVGCGGTWQKDGTCDGCSELRRLDEPAFAEYLDATDADERAFLTNHTKLWCDEHGFARQSEWTTDKVCRRKDGSSIHQGPFTRLH